MYCRVSTHITFSCGYTWDRHRPESFFVSFFLVIAQHSLPGCLAFLRLLVLSHKSLHSLALKT